MSVIPLRDPLTMGGVPARSRSTKSPTPARRAAAGGVPKGAPVAWFADAARRLGAATRAAGLVVPAFRCPPRVPGTTRTIRRYPGGAVVSVVLAGRRTEEVAIDMVEGVMVVNRLEGDAALRFRTTLLEATGATSRPVPAPKPVEAPSPERHTQAA